MAEERRDPTMRPPSPWSFRKTHDVNFGLLLCRVYSVLFDCVSLYVAIARRVSVVLCVLVCYVCVVSCMCYNIDLALMILHELLVVCVIILTYKDAMRLHRR